MSDRIRSAPDVRFTHPGVGVTPLFICARCGVKKSGYGSRLQLVQGVKQKVCAGCAK
jgi:hypothetical protein